MAASLHSWACCQLGHTVQLAARLLFPQTFLSTSWCLFFDRFHRGVSLGILSGSPLCSLSLFYLSPFPFLLSFSPFSSLLLVSPFFLLSSSPLFLCFPFPKVFAQRGFAQSGNTLRPKRGLSSHVDVLSRRWCLSVALPMCRLRCRCRLCCWLPGPLATSLHRLLALSSPVFLPPLI